MSKLSMNCNPDTKKLKYNRKQLGLSQEFVAMKLGITQKAYSDIESGKTKLKNEVLNDIAKILEISPFEVCPISCDCSSELRKRHNELIEYLNNKGINIPEEFI